MRVVTVEQMRAIEAAAEHEYGMDGPTLMAAAGASAAETAAKWLGSDLPGTTWLLLIGPGNNGGDGRVMARHLAAQGAEVMLFDWKANQLTNRDGQPLTGQLDDVIARADVVVDALLGTGHSRPLDQTMVALNDRVRAAIRTRHGTPHVIALDVPSGIDSDSGAADQGVLAADLTITLACPKIGLFFYPAMDFVGDLRVGSIGLNPAQDLGGLAEWMTPAMVSALVPPRPNDGFKGSFGKVLAVAGSPRFPGAALLTATAAYRAGAGLVTLATIPALTAAYVAGLPEAVYALLPDEVWQRAEMIIDAARGAQSVLIGPGIDQQAGTREWLLAVLAGLRQLPATERPSLVLDADALNLLSREPNWWTLPPPNAVLTPHPGEMSRLIGSTKVSAGGPDRLQAIREHGANWGHVVVLKGAVTIIAGPTGAERERPWLNAAPNPAMASAGMGDVLAGAIAGLLAQGMEPFAAAALGVALHSEAGARAARDMGFIRAGLLAGDVANNLPVARAHYEEMSAGRD